MTKLTPEQNACNVATYEHIIELQRFMHLIIVDLMQRARVHDQSKLKSPEVEGFASVMNDLAPSTFNSPEYNAAKAAIPDALAHHYAHNTHHPEFAAFHEEWRPVLNYEDYYEVSDRGAVRSRDRLIPRSGPTGATFR